MHFLIDFENTGNNGFTGTEYLDKNDEVTIFYSNMAKNIENGIVKKLNNADCRINTCRLWEQGKNGLDFYIASKTGELFGRG